MFSKCVVCIMVILLSALPVMAEEPKPEQSYKVAGWLLWLGGGAMVYSSLEGGKFKVKHSELFVGGTATMFLGSYLMFKKAEPNKFQLLVGKKQASCVLQILKFYQTQGCS